MAYRLHRNIDKLLNDWGMNEMNIILIEWYLLFVCLIVTMILVILKKRTATIVLVAVAILLHILLHWNMVLNHWLSLFR